MRPGIPQLLLLLLVLASGYALPDTGPAQNRKLAYLVSDLRIPFWEIMRRGIAHQAGQLGYRVDAYSAENDAKRELQFTVQAIRNQVDGIILSPTNSSAAVTVLSLADKAGIPVVIADIGSEGGEYVSYIASDNFTGSYQLGRILAAALQERGWQDGSVGIIAIPQKRANGKARTAGFMKALGEAGIKGGDIRQQVNFSYQETYDFARELIAADPNLRALWLQGSDRYQGAIDAIAEAGKTAEVLLLCFDAEPEFLEMIPAGSLLGSGMQQPFRIGEEAVSTLHQHLQGKQVPREKLMPVLAVSRRNIEGKLGVIRRNVLGQPEE